MLRLARHVLRDAADAEDVVQQVFSKLLASSDPERDVSRGYLLRAVRNESLRIIAGRKRLLCVDPDSFDAYVGPGDPPAPSIENDDALTALCRVLSAREGAVVQLRAMGAKTREIAEALRMSESTVRSHLWHVRLVFKRERASARARRPST